ncbi:MAG: hypothetical protein ACK4QW_10305 [Alphaproteobacteria bacterium]
MSRPGGSALHALRTGDARFVLLRYAGAGLGAAKALVFAHLLDVAVFGIVALVLQTAALLEAAMLGGVTGLLHRYFNDPAAGEESFARFVPAAGAWLAGVAVLALALGAAWEVLFWSALLFALGSGFLLLEPSLRVRGRLGLVALPPILLNLLSLALVPALLWLRADPPLWTILAALVASQAGAQAIFLRLVLTRERVPAARQGRGPLRLWTDYLDFVRAGFPIFLGSMAYMLLTYVDRFFIATFHPAPDLGVHALAAQFALIGLVGLQGWSYVAAVRIGTAIKEDRPVAPVVRRALHVAAAIGGAALAALLALSWILEATLFARYQGLFAAVALGAPGLVAYNAVSAAAALLYYRQRQKPLHRALLTVLAANVAIDLGLSLAGASYLWIVGATGGLFLCLAAAAAAFVRRCLDGSAPLAAGAGGGV